MPQSSDGYTGTLLRIDLTSKRATRESWDEATQRKYIGGTGLGAKILYDEVPPAVECFSPENRLIIASGPLGGTTVKGSGTISVVTKGPLTNGATSSQANGFFGAYLRLCGFDGIILEGSLDEWGYLYINEAGVEFREAKDLVGKDVGEVERKIKGAIGLPEQSVSVLGIGLAGENLVKFAAIVGDGGHVVAHNGPGAVMGSKKVKAIAVSRGNHRIPIRDRQKLTRTSNDFLDVVKQDTDWGGVFKWGMLGSTASLNSPKFWTVKNYTASFLDCPDSDREKFSGPYIRGHYNPKPHSCWACPFHHCTNIEINEGRYKGFRGEEPEAECMSAWGFLIGNTDVEGMIVLSSDCDEIGIDANEAGWVIALVMEMYDKGLITKKETGGLDMSWGNVDGVRRMLRLIANRQGIGNILAEGTLRASQELGKGAPELGVYIMSGATPRTHDLRRRWNELFDTVVSNICTIENDGFPRPTDYGLPPLGNAFDPMEVSGLTAQLKGTFQFLDSLGVCKFPNRQVPRFLIPMVQAATGWDICEEEAMVIGRRIINLLRAFNVRHGFTPDKECPSLRLGSAPTDGPAKGKSILPVLPQMLDNYYRQMGWDRQTGKPLEKTLNDLELSAVARDLWHR